MRAFITGITGFIGGYLHRLLKEKGWEVSGIGLEASEGGEWIEGNLLEVDLSDFLSDFRPDVVFHLAARSHVGRSWEEMDSTLYENLFSTHRLLKTLASLKLKPLFILASSAEVYGPVPEKEQPIEEERRPAPVTPYGLSKLSCEELALFYWRAYGIKSVIVRLFNQIGPGQRPSFVTSYFAKRIAEIEKGLTPPVLEVGNLEARRDFTDVRDGVEALSLLAEKGRGGEIYNLGSGRAYSISEILEILLSYSEKEIRVEVKRSRLRRKDVPLFWASIRKLNAKTGWVPSIPIEKTLLDILEYWRGRV